MRCTAFFCVMLLGAACTSAAFDKAAFDALPNSKKMQTVLDALKARDRKLNNFSFTLTEVIYADKTLIHRRRCDLKRLDGSYLYHNQFLERCNGLPLYQLWINFDGRRSTTLTEQQGTLRGAIREKETDTFLNEILYTNMLGYRAEYRAVSVAEQLALDVTKYNDPYEVKTVEWEGRTLISYSTIEGPDSIDFYFFDPDRDFMLTHFQRGHRIERPVQGPDAYADVTEASNESGLWVPMQVRHWLSPPGNTTINYEVESFSRGTVRPEDLWFGFPVGTKVVDLTSKISYTIEKGGRKRGGYYYDPQTRQVHGPDGKVIPNRPPPPIEPPAAIKPMLTAGASAPAFSVPATDGRTMKLSEQKGKVVVLDFWATWCPPCVASLPHLQQSSADQSRVKKGLLVWAVNDREEEATVKKFLNDKHYTFTVPTSAAGEVSADYGVQTIPTIMVIERDGRTRSIFVGYGTATELAIDKAVDAALADSGGLSSETY